MLQKHQENFKMVRKKFQKYAYKVLYVCELMSFPFRCNASKIWSWKLFVEHDRYLTARWYSYVDKVIYLAVTSII